MSFKHTLKRHRHRFQRWFFPAVGYWALRLLGATQRVRVEDPCGILAAWQAGGGGPQVQVFWHDELLMMPWLYQRVRFTRRTSAMISQNFCGDVIAGICAKFGVGAARGSPSRGGKEAVRDLANEVIGGNMVGITPDGSRGPRHQIKPGVFMIARRAKAELVPIRISHRWKVCLPTWDRFQIPLPFSTVTLTFLPTLAWNDPQLSEKLCATLGGTIFSEA